MKLVRITMSVNVDLDTFDKSEIADYLTDKLYQDPEFFNQFDEDNIVSVEHDADYDDEE